MGDTTQLYNECGTQVISFVNGDELQRLAAILAMMPGYHIVSAHMGLLAPGLGQVPGWRTGCDRRCRITVSHEMVRMQKDHRANNPNWGPTYTQ